MVKANFYRWYDEPDFTSIRVDPRYIKELTNRSISKAGSIVNLSRLTGLSTTTIHNYKTLVSLNVRGLKLFLDFLGIKYDRINHRIKKISWNVRHFNIDFNSREMAILLAASLADGHLNKSSFMYKNKDRNLINKVKRATIKLFKEVKINSRVDRNGTPYIVCPKFVSKQLEKLGSPCGKKLFSNPRVPSIIRDGTKIQKRLFIQQFFDDEGWVESENLRVAAAQSSETSEILPKRLIKNLSLNQKYNVSSLSNKIKVKIIKPNILIDIQEILKKDFGIESHLTFKGITKYKRINSDRFYVSAKWELEFRKKLDVKLFEQRINFYAPRKKALLKEMLREKKVPNFILVKLLNMVIKYHKLKGKFKVKDIQKEINLNRGNIRKRLSTLVNKGVLSNAKGTYTLNLEI